MLLTLGYLQLPPGIAQCGEQIQFEAGFCAQVVLQVLSLVLQGGER